MYVCVMCGYVNRVSRSQVVLCVLRCVCGSLKINCADHSGALSHTDLLTLTHALVQRIHVNANTSEFAFMTEMRGGGGATATRWRRLRHTVWLY